MLCCRTGGPTDGPTATVGRSVERLQINSIVDAAAVDVFRLKRSGRQRSSDETIRRWVNVAGRVVARLWSSNNFSYVTGVLYPLLFGKECPLLKSVL